MQRALCLLAVVTIAGSTLTGCANKPEQDPEYLEYREYRKALWGNAPHMGLPPVSPREADVFVTDRGYMVVLPRNGITGQPALAGAIDGDELPLPRIVQPSELPQSEWETLRAQARVLARTSGRDNSAGQEQRPQP